MKKLFILIALFTAMRGYSQWTVLSTGYTNVSLSDITQTPSGRLIAVGTGFSGLDFMPHIFTSDNQGSTWDTTQFAPPGFFFQSIGFLNSQEGYIGGFGAFSTFTQTTDGGNTWAYYYEDSTNSGINDIDVIDSLHAVACGYGPVPFSSGSAYVLTNPATWAPVVQTFPASTLDDIQMLNPDTGYALSYSAKEIYGTTDGGTTWMLINTFPISVGKMYWWDVNTGIVVGARAHYYRTVSGGNLWSADSIPGNTSNELTGVAFFDYNNGYACATNGKIFQSSDGGITWTLEPTATTNDLYNLEIHGGYAYAVGANGTILRHEDPTSVSQITDQATARIFPNPVHNVLNIELTGSSPGNILLAEVTGSDGQIILENFSVSKKNQLQFDVSQLPKGIYFFRVIAENKIYSGKAVVM